MQRNNITMDAMTVMRDGVALSAPISMDIAQGEVVQVLGPNGAGKSTLLKMLAGLLAVPHGRVTFNLGASSRRLYLGHKRGVVASLSVADNVAFWARAYGVRELTPAALRYFDLEDVASVRASELSAGWQQRVALTRLITIPAPLWLLDEPTANLDQAGLALLQSLLQSRLEQGGIALIASHIPMQGPNVRTLDLARATPLLSQGALC